jgi:hypothetical protein
MGQTFELIWLGCRGKTIKERSNSYYSESSMNREMDENINDA